MDNKKSKRGRTKPLGGHSSATARKKSKDMDDSEQEMRDRMEAASVLSSLRFLTPQSKEPASASSADKVVDKVPKIPVTYKMSDKNHGNPTILSTAPPAHVGKPATKYIASGRGSGKEHGIPSQGVVISEQANKFILMHLYNSLQNRQGKTETVTTTTNEPNIPNNLPSESIIPKSEAARKGTPVTVKNASPLPNVLQPANPVNKTVAAALRNAIPTATRERLQNVQDQLDNVKNKAANLHDNFFIHQLQAATLKKYEDNIKEEKDSETHESDSEKNKKTESTEKGLPLKKRRIFSQSGDKSDLTISNLDDFSAAHLDYNSESDVKNLLQLAQSTQMTSMVTGTASHKPYSGDGYKPIDPSASLRVLSDVKQALTPDEDGDLPLHIAVVHKNNELVKRFVDIMTMSGKSVDRYNKLTQTPLHLAVLVRETDIIMSLLSAKADPNLVDRNGCTAMHIAVEKGFQDCLETILEYSVYDCDLDTRNYEGYTPLHTAVEEDNLAMLVCLVKNGANIDGQDGKAGRSVLHYAVEYSRLDIVKYLHEHNANIDLPNYAGITPCMAAQPANLQKTLDIIGKGSETSKSIEDLSSLHASRKMPIPRIPSKASLIVSEQAQVFGLLRSNSMEEVKPFKLRRASSSDPVDLSLSEAAKASKASVRNLQSYPSQDDNTRIVEKHAVLVEQLRRRRQSDSETYINIPRESYKALLALKAAADAKKGQNSSLYTEERKDNELVSNTKLATSVKTPVRSKLDKPVLSAEEYSLLQKIKAAKNKPGKEGQEAVLGVILDRDLNKNLSKLGKGPFDFESVEKAKDMLKEPPSLKDFHAEESEKKLKRNEKMTQRSKSNSSSSLKSMEVDKLDSPKIGAEDTDMPVLSRQCSVSSDQGKNLSSSLSKNKDSETAEDSSGLRFSQGFETKDIENETSEEIDLGEVSNVKSQCEIGSKDNIEHEEMDFEENFTHIEHRKKQENEDTSSVEVTMDEDDDHALVIDERENDDKESDTESMKAVSKSEENTDLIDVNKIGYQLLGGKINIESVWTQNKPDNFSCGNNTSQKEVDNSSPKTENIARFSNESTDSADIDEPDVIYSRNDSGNTGQQPLIHKSDSNFHNQEVKESERTPQDGNNLHQISDKEASIDEKGKRNEEYEEMMCKVNEKKEWETDSLATSTPPPLSRFGQILTIDGVDKSAVRNINTPPVLSKFGESEDQASETLGSYVTCISGVKSSKSKDDINRPPNLVSSSEFMKFSSNTDTEHQGFLPEEPAKSNNSVGNFVEFEDNKVEEHVTKSAQSKSTSKREASEKGEIEGEKLVQNDEVEKFYSLKDLADADALLTAKTVQANVGSLENKEVMKNIDVIKVSKAHTLYFFDGATYRSLKLYIDDSEASSEQFKKIFSENSRSDLASVSLSSQTCLPIVSSSKVPTDSQRRCETLTTGNENNQKQERTKDGNSLNEEGSTNYISELRRKKVTEVTSYDLDSRILKNVGRSCSETNLFANSSKVLELAKSQFNKSQLLNAKKFGSVSNVDSNIQGLLKSDSVKWLGSSSFVYTNSSDMNLTSVVDNTVIHPGQSDTVQDLSKKTSKILSKPVTSQTTVKPTPTKLVSMPRTLGMAAGKAVVSTSEGTLTRINPDIKNKLSKALNSPSRKLHIVKSDSSEKLFPALDVSEVSVSKETSSKEVGLRLQL